MGALICHAALFVSVLLTTAPFALLAAPVEPHAQNAALTLAPPVLAQVEDLGFWHQYKWRIVGTGALLTLESVLIAALLFERQNKKAAARLLAESEEFNRRIVQSSSDCIKVLDPDGNLVYISEQGQTLLEVNRVEDLLGASWIGMWKGEERDKAKAAFAKACNGEIGSFRGFGKTLKGQPKWWHTVISPLRGAGKNVERFIAVSRDMTEHELSLRAMEESEKELTQLTVRLFNIQDEERRRIARELHDGTAQNLFAISINLQKLGHTSPANNGDADQLIGESQSLVEQSLKEIRTLSYLLHPPLLDQAGLVSALQWYVEGFSKRSGIYIDLHAQPIGRLPSDVEMALFRVVQEALSNVRRHSESETASIRLEHRHSAIVLEIKDRGHGLSLDGNGLDSNGSVCPGVGIPGMKQRLRQLGGKLEITSNGHGTTVSAVVPIVNGGNHGSNTSR